jgi:hypothetical protein
MSLEPCCPAASRWFALKIETVSSSRKEITHSQDSPQSKPHPDFPPLVAMPQSEAHLKKLSLLKNVNSVCTLKQGVESN